MNSVGTEFMKNKINRWKQKGNCHTDMSEELIVCIREVTHTQSLGIFCAFVYFNFISAKAGIFSH